MVQMSTLLRIALVGRQFAGWYADAGQALRAECKAEGWDFHRYVDVLAITSPRVQVARNFAIARHYMRKGKLPAGVLKMVHAGIAHWEQTGEIRGPKTGPFARALSGDPDALVLDVWMAVALGVEQKHLPRKDVAKAAAVRVRGVADTLGLSVAEAQAAVWCGAIVNAGKVPARFERNVLGEWVLNTRASRPLL